MVSRGISDHRSKWHWRIFYMTHGWEKKTRKQAVVERRGNGCKHLPSDDEIKLTNSGMEDAANTVIKLYVTNSILCIIL